MKPTNIVNKLKAKQANLVELAGNKLLLDASGALIWPAESMLVVSDLHFEKGSFLGVFGNPIPHYDSRKTLQNLLRVIEQYSPQHVLCLGDSFHDHNAWQRLSEQEKQDMIELVNLQPRWTWILGNHDPDLPSELPGEKVTELSIKNLLFLHEPKLPIAPQTAQIFGHFHPKMTKSVSRQRMSGRCFMYDQMKMVMPSFGAYTGGLSIDDSAFEALFNYRAASKHLIYNSKIHSF